MGRAEDRNDLVRPLLDDSSFKLLDGVEPQIGKAGGQSGCCFIATSRDEAHEVADRGGKEGLSRRGFAEYQDFVREVEEGYRLWQEEYSNDLDKRDSLHRILREVAERSPSLHAKLMELVEPLDRRFEAATRPIPPDALIWEHLKRRAERGEDDPRLESFQQRVLRMRLPKKMDERMKRSFLEIDFDTP